MGVEDYIAEELPLQVIAEANDWFDSQQRDEDDAQFIERFYESLNFSIEESAEYQYMIGQYLTRHRG